MIARVLYVALVAILVRVLWRILFERVEASARAGSAAARGGDRAPGLHKGLMVKDPVCGIHLPESRALVELRAGERLYFCSERCRSAFGSTGS